MDELEFALETIDEQRFEDFVMAFLRKEGHEVHLRNQCSLIHVI